MKSSLSFAKAWFAVSLLVLAFGYGFASHAWGLFPKTFVERAWQQGYWLAKGYSSFEEDFSHEKVSDRQGAHTFRREKIQPGLTTVTSWWKEAGETKVGMKLIDRKGAVLHEWFIDRRQAFGSLAQRKDPTRTDIQGSVLLSGGDVVMNLEYVGMVRMNSCGEILWKVAEGNHHSIAQADDGSFWVPGVSQKLRTGTKKHPDLPGLGSIWLDQILHVSEEGEILKDIKVVDILYDNDLERFLFKYEEMEGDVTHLNDVEPLSSSLADEYPMFESGDLLVSLPTLQLVFVFDLDSGEVKWHASDPFIHQHDPDFIGGGWLGVFDNNTARGPAMEEGSRIVAFQPHTDSTKILFQPDKLDQFFYTKHRGKWQMLRNGNMLLTHESAGRAIEVTSEGDPVWEWVHESYDSRVPSLSKANRHDLTRQEVASWPCSSIDSVSTAQKQQTAP